MKKVEKNENLHKMLQFEFPVPTHDVDFSNVRADEVKQDDFFFALNDKYIPKFIKLKDEYNIKLAFQNARHLKLKRYGQTNPKEFFNNSINQ